MRLSHLFAMSLLLGSSLVACGGDDGGGGGGVDAAPAIDAPPDAPPALVGLGQICNQTTACPASAPVCLVLMQGATQGFCSLLCHADAQFMTNANAQVDSVTDLTADDAKCTAQYTGTAGVASCFLPLDRTPAGALQANTTYTFQAHCAISCGPNNTCGTGLTCNTTNMLCQP